MSGRDVKPLTVSDDFSSSGSSSGSVMAAGKAADAARNFDKFLERLPAKELIDAVGQFFRGRTVDDFLRRRGQNELLRGIRQRVVRDQRSDVAQFGRV